jgi:hypothetical protein
MLSFYNSAGPRRSIFIGFNNYQFLFRDLLFWRAVLNTLLYTVLFLSLQIPLSLGLALLLNNKAVRFRNFFRFAFFSSHLVGNVFVAVLFMLLLSPRQGLVNKMIGAAFPFLGTELNWRGNAALAMPAIVLASLASGSGSGAIRSCRSGRRGPLGPVLARHHPRHPSRADLHPAGWNDRCVSAFRVALCVLRRPRPRLRGAHHRHVPLSAGL